MQDENVKKEQPKIRQLVITMNEATGKISCNSNFTPEKSIVLLEAYKSHLVSVNFNFFSTTEGGNTDESKSGEKAEA